MKNLSEKIGILAFVVLSLVLKERYLFEQAFPDKGNKFYIYLCVVASLILIWTLFLKFKNQVLVLTIINLFFSLVFVGDILYMRYYGEFLSFYMIPQAKYINEINSSITSLLNYTDLIVFLDIIGLIILCGYLFRNKKGSNRSNIYTVIPLALAVLIIGIFAVNKKMVASKDILTHKWDSKYVAREMGVLYYHYNDLKEYLFDEFSKLAISEEEAQEILDDVPNQVKSDNYGIAKDSNLIVIQVEALQDFVINKEINGKEITPNLNKLIDESMYFNKMYGQTAGGNTVDAEFMLNNSLYPAPVGAAYFTDTFNTYNALPKLLKENGYPNVVAMHGYDKNFWNRNSAYQSFGYDKFYSSEDYNGNTIGWGIEDNEFLAQSLETLKELQEPFFSFIVTLSSHHPFDMFKDFNEFDLGEFADTQLADYIEAIHYTDKAIGNFIDYLKKEGLFDTSTIVIYGDHRGLRDDQNDILGEFMNVKVNNVTINNIYNKIPLIINTPHNLVQGVYENAIGQINILPMILDLLGIENNYMLGANTLIDELVPVVFRNGSIIYSNYFYDKDEDKVYNTETYEEVSKYSISDVIEEGLQKLQLSDSILKYDILGK